jgi:nucleoside-diphosphate-sugar epimerase
MRRALVTGATGFIGRQLVRRLAADGVAVRAWVRPSSDLSAFVGLDIETVEVPFAEGCDTVFHQASRLKVTWEPDFVPANAALTQQVIDACRAAGSAPRLVHVSSMAAVGPSVSEAGTDERAPAQVISRYGQMKAEMERLVTEASGDVPVLIARPPGVFGAGDASFAPLFQRAARGRSLVPGDGRVSVSLIQVTDLVDGLIRCASAEQTVDGGSGRGVFHLSGREFTDPIDLCQRIAAAAGRRHPPIARVPWWVIETAGAAVEAWARLRQQKAVLTRDKVKELRRPWRCDGRKAYRLLGFDPAPLDQAIAEALCSYSDPIA